MTKLNETKILPKKTARIISLILLLIVANTAIVTAETNNPFKPLEYVGPAVPFKVEEDKTWIFLGEDRIVIDVVGETVRSKFIARSKDYFPDGITDEMIDQFVEETINVCNFNSHDRISYIMKRPEVKDRSRILFEVHFIGEETRYLTDGSFEVLLQWNGERCVGLYSPETGPLRLNPVRHVIGR